MGVAVQTQGRSCSSILVVDDDLAIRDAIRDMLECEGYSVATASDGKQAIERLRQAGQPCLVLLDLMMPVMNGHEFLRVIRSDDGLAPLPVIVLTAWHDEEGVGEFVQGVVKKPVDLMRLLTFVERYCGNGDGTECDTSPPR